MSIKTAATLPRAKVLQNDSLRIALAHAVDVLAKLPAAQRDAGVAEVTALITAAQALITALDPTPAP